MMTIVFPLYLLDDGKVFEHLIHVPTGKEVLPIFTSLDMAAYFISVKGAQDRTRAAEFRDPIGLAETLERQAAIEGEQFEVWWDCKRMQLAIEVASRLRSQQCSMGGN